MIFIIEAFFSGCISKVINDGKDYSWTKIKRVINDKNDRSLSTRIYRVIEKTLNIVTDKKFKDTDGLYETIERIFIEFRDNGDTIESVRWGLKSLGLDVSDQRCENFLEKFYEEIRHNDNLYKEIIMTLQQKGIKINQEEFQNLNEKIDRNYIELIVKIDSMKDNLNGSTSLINKERELKFKSNKKQDYIKNWNSRLFLHKKNEKNPITLADVFIIPEVGLRINDYNNIMIPSEKPLLEIIVERFIMSDRTLTMLITGVPGIGKTSIVSWIAQKYATCEKIIILRFRDWDSEELECGLLKAVCSILECKRKDLDGKIIVLDGFDEMKALDRRNYILSEFLNDIKDLRNSKFIITSRNTYISEENIGYIVELKPFNISKIIRFCNNLGVDLNENCMYIDNLDVLGIPVILYMAVMSNIDVAKKITKPELYNRIFAEKGGIFDKFNNGEHEYSKGSQIMRNSINTKDYLKFLRDIAYRMFEKDILCLEIKDCKIPELIFNGEKVSILEFPIKNFFESPEQNVEFIHKSIYEYFVAEYIHYAIDNILNKEGKVDINLAEVLGKILKSNVLTSEILEFLKFKIINSNGVSQQMGR